MTISERMKDGFFEQILFAVIQGRILGDLLAEESATSRLKQIGLMTVICALSVDQKILTLAKLIEVTGLTRSGVVETVNPLAKRGLLIETMGKNAMGRGTARQFEIAPAVKATISAIFNGSLGLDNRGHST